jgi:diaminopimelate epimerase
MTEFIKMSGCGNDFIALVEPASAPAEGAIRAWCRRGISLGADGVFTLRRLRPQVVEMRYWNADGGVAALCLNGTRCAAQLAFHLGWSSDRVTVRTGAGELAARRLDSGAVAVEAPLPEPPTETMLTTADGAFTGWLARVGVPHFVCFRDQRVESVPLDHWSPPLRHHRDLGAEGANVDFAELRGRHDFTIRSFERGIEGETLACGTGVLATAAAALAAGLAELPIRALTRGGFTLEVLGEAEGARVKRWELAGDARVVAEGTLLPEAVAPSSAPTVR